MALLPTILSALFAGLGAVGVLWPETLIEFGRMFATPNGLFLAAGLRIVFGGSLLIAARASRAPTVLRWFGAAILIAGLATPLFGVERARSVLAAMSADGGAWVRVIGAVAIVLGSSFVWALAPRGGGPPWR